MTAKAAMATNPISGYRWVPPTDLSDRRNQKRLSPDAIRAFFKIANKWSLKEEENCLLLGGISPSSLYGLKKNPDEAVLNQDELTRISLLVGIYKALNILFDDDYANAWVELTNNNPIFGGATPVQYMIHNGLPGIQIVRQLLDSRRGGR